MSVTGPDYYAVLGVPSSTDAAGLRVAYRELAARWHPDRHPDDDAAGARFKALVEAYSVLADEERRRAYDMGRLPEVLPVERASTLTEAIGALVDRVFGIGDQRSRPGRNRVYRLTVPFVEAMRGSTQHLELPNSQPCASCAGRGFAAGVIPEICPRCLGLGELLARPLLRSAYFTCERCEGRGYIITEPCDRCHGRGELDARERVAIELPPGTDEGSSLRIRGAGEPGRGGGRDGDLHVKVSVLPHATLRRLGDDITLTRPVPVFLAVIGGTLRVPTIYGPRAFRVPPGSRDGDTLIMTGFGIPKADGGAGDQLVRLSLEMPKDLAAEPLAKLKAAIAALPSGAFPLSQRFEVDDD